MSNDDSVRYGKPPKHSQFKKGQSGNPKGRPKKQRSADDGVDRILDKVSKRHTGRRAVAMTDLEVMRHNIVLLALKGDPRAAAEVERYHDRRLRLRAAAEPTGGPIVVRSPAQTPLDSSSKPSAKRRKAALARRNAALSELQSLDRLLDRIIPIPVGGRIRKMTVLDAIRSMTLAKGSKGDLRSARLIESLNEKRHRRRAEDGKRVYSALIVYARPETPAESAALERELEEQQAPFRCNRGELPGEEI